MASFDHCRIKLSAGERAAKSKNYEKHLARMDHGIAVLQAEYGKLGKFKDNPDGAAQAAVRHMIDERKVKRRQFQLEMEARARAFSDIEKHPDGRGAGLMSLLVRPFRQGSFARSSIEELTHAEQAKAHVFFAEGFEKLRSRWFGLSQNKDLLRDVARVVHGGEALSPDPKLKKAAGEIAAAWTKTAEHLKARFNEFGGDIKTRVDWGLKQIHDPDLLVKAGREAWVEQTLPLVDPDRMRETMIAILGGEDGRPVAVSESTTREMLAAIYGNIVEGESLVSSGERAAVKNRHLHSRVLAFKDAESWLKYNDSFGVTDVFSVMTGHINTLSREIAMMQQLGPNPAAMFDELRAEVALSGYGGKKLPFVAAKTSDDAKLVALDSVWKQVNGDNDIPATGAIANVFGTLRHLETAAVLGGATLSSFGDLGTSAITAAYNRMSVVKTMKRQLAALGSSEEDRIFAHRLGVIMDASSGRMRAAHEATGIGRASKMSEFTIRASGLQAWTESLKMGFHMSILADMADALRFGFKEADQGHNGMLSRHGWTEGDWDALRSVDPLDYKGAKFVALENILASDKLQAGVKERLTDLLTKTTKGETSLAVPEPGERTLGIMRGRQAQRGTLSGEMRRSVGLFKSFAFEMGTGHGSRLFSQESTKDKLGYGVGLMAATTLFGAVSYQAKAISRGREPVAWDDPRSWGAFAMQGGGLGLLGDFFISGIGGADRFGHGFVVSMAGPIAGMADDAAKLVAMGAKGLAEGEVLPNSGAVRTASRYVPGSSLWYGRLAYERLFVDKLQAAVDPSGARRSWRAQEKFYRENFGQEYFVRPGEIER